jgi:hypothetical protein
MIKKTLFRGLSLAAIVRALDKQTGTKAQA